MTLLELMVATAVIALGVLGLTATFGAIQRGIQTGKNKTLASNLAQEKMQIVKQQTYFKVIPTSNPSYLPAPDGSPYDTAYFPPEPIVQGGVPFQRYTYVQVVAENSGVLNALPPTTPDTGMRQITVMVTWPELGQTKKVTINSVMSNPNTVEANCIFTGTVQNAAPPNNPIVGALVNIAESQGWRGTSDGGGSYTIQLSPGSFNIWASARGYFPQTSFQTIGPNNTVTVNFQLTAMSSGSIVGSAWINPAVVISQVVVSTVQASHGGYDVEYIELFNPTTGAVTVSGGVDLHFAGWNGNRECDKIPLVYVSTRILANQYFLIANTTTFTVNGASISADAYYTDAANASCSPNAPQWNPPTVREIADRNHAGTWWLTDGSGAILDAVGWSRNGLTHSPSHCEGSCVYTANGLDAGWELVRLSSPGFASSSFGRAYNSGNNLLDFTTSTTLQYSPFNTASLLQAPIAGVPAVGAVVSANDGLSSIVAAASAGSPPAANFALTQVATGTWTVFITSNSYQLRTDTVTISASGSVVAFPSSTTMLNQAATSGFITGTVTDANGNPISAPSAIQVTPIGRGPAVTANTANGAYALSVATGRPVNVTANLNFLNPNYVSVSSNGLSVGLGQVKSGVNFILTQGGRLTGFITRDGVNGLQGETVKVTDVNGNAMDQEVSDVNGTFTTVTLGTGTYTVRIPLDGTESSNPTVATASAVLGQTVFVATFTITGALGTITGNVTLNGKTLATGALIVVATRTITTPPALSSATLASGSYYAASSREDGTYSVQVRQSTSPAYNVFAWYSSVDGAGNVTITPRSISNIPVTAGQTVSGENLAW